jgi:hypothetical protein
MRDGGETDPTMGALLTALEQQRNAALNQVAHATAQMAVMRAQLTAAQNRVAELERAAEKPDAKKARAA